MCWDMVQDVTGNRGQIFRRNISCSGALTICRCVPVFQVVSTRLTEHSSKRQRLLKTTLRQSQLRDATGRNQMCCMRAMQRAPVAQKRKWSSFHIILIRNIQIPSNSHSYLYVISIDLILLRQICVPALPTCTTKKMVGLFGTTSSRHGQ